MSPGLTYPLAGGLGGLAWASALRGWMVELAGPTESEVTWLTFLLVLSPGTMVGVAFGRAAHLRSAGRQASRAIVLAPLLLASAILDHQPSSPPERAAARFSLSPPCWPEATRSATPDGPPHGSRLPRSRSSAWVRCSRSAPWRPHSPRPAGSGSPCSVPHSSHSPASPHLCPTHALDSRRIPPRNKPSKDSDEVKLNRPGMSGDFGLPRVLRSRDWLDLMPR